MKRVLCAFAAATLMACPPVNTMTDLCKGRMAGDLVISEVMINPEGTDTGSEWIEVFNTLGTPLDLKGLTLYVRDTDGSGAKSHVIRAGTAPARGYFVAGDIRSGPNPSWVNYAYADALGSMGNSRGVVGIRCGMTTLAEFTYTSAAADSRSRQLNGLEEPNATLASVEANYCDTPVGTTYFGNNAGTPGVANPQCRPEAMAGTCIDNGTVRAITGPAPGDLVINEVMADPSAVTDTTGEWIELFARSNVDLNDVVISTTSGSTRVVSQNCIRVQSGQYVLLARSADSFVNGNLPPPAYVYSSLSLANDPQQLALSRGDGGIDAVSLVAPTSGRSLQLDPTKQDPQLNDDPTAFCPAPQRWVPDAGGDFGSPGAANPSCGNVIDCTGRAAGDFIVTELMLDPDGTDTGQEWIELFNPRSTDAVLTGLTLYKKNVDGTGEVTHSITGGVVPANGYFVLGDVRSGTNPAWINATYGAGLGSLSNTSGIVGVRCGSLVLGEFAYNVPGRAARSRMLDGTTQPPTTALAIEANYCDTPPGALYFGNNAGTPGSANPACEPEATTGTCIEDGGMRSITAPNAGDLIITEVMSDSTAPDTTGEWFELLARAPVDLNDLTVYTTTTSARLTSGACMRVNPGEYVLLARSADSFVNGDLPAPRFTYGGPSFTNGANQRIGLSRGDAGIDEIALAPSSTGVSWQLDPMLLDPAANDAPTSFCSAPNKWNPDGGGDFGSPGTVNAACRAPGTCLDTGTNLPRPVNAPPDGDLLITEWMTDPGPIADGDGEYFEFLAKSAFDLNGVAFRVGTTGAPRIIATSNNCLPASANQYFVVGRNPNMAANGNLPPFIATLSATALTTTSVVTLFNPDGGVADTVTTAGGGNGFSQQVNPNFLTPAGNDTNQCPTPAGTVYGTSGNRGTPGLANVACP
jgi:hypothetical protein